MLRHQKKTKQHTSFRARFILTLSISQGFFLPPFLYRRFLAFFSHGSSICFFRHYAIDGVHGCKQVCTCRSCSTSASQTTSTISKKANSIFLSARTSYISNMMGSWQVNSVLRNYISCSFLCAFTWNVNKFLRFYCEVFCVSILNFKKSKIRADT